MRGSAGSLLYASGDKNGGCLGGSMIVPQYTGVPGGICLGVLYIITKM